MGPHRSLLVGAVTILAACAAWPAHAAPRPRCADEKAQTVLRSPTIVVSRYAAAVAQTGARRVVYRACWVQTGRRLIVGTDQYDEPASRPRTPSAAVIYDRAFRVLDGRYLVNSLTAQTATSRARDVRTFDMKRGRPLYATSRCDEVFNGYDSGPDEVAVLPRGGLAYWCTNKLPDNGPPTLGGLWVVTARGEVQLESEGVDIAAMALSQSGRILYWTVLVDGVRVARSAPLA